MNLKEDVRNYILSAFPMARKNKINFENSLLETGIIDSLGVLEIVNYLSEQMQIEIEEEDLTQDNFRSVESIVRLIERKKRMA